MHGIRLRNQGLQGQYQGQGRPSGCCFILHRQPAGAIVTQVPYPTCPSPPPTWCVTSTRVLPASSPQMHLSNKCRPAHRSE